MRSPRALVPGQQRRPLPPIARGAVEPAAGDPRGQRALGVARRRVGVARRDRAASRRSLRDAVQDAGVALRDRWDVGSPCAPRTYARRTAREDGAAPRRARAPGDRPRDGARTTGQGPSALRGGGAAPLRPPRRVAVRVSARRVPGLQEGSPRRLLVRVPRSVPELFRETRVRLCRALWACSRRARRGDGRSCRAGPRRAERHFRRRGHQRGAPGSRARPRRAWWREPSRRGLRKTLLLRAARARASAPAS
jgi:hypothetical protein